MKRFLSILLVAVLALGLMATSAFAAAGISVEKTGEVTVTLKATDVTFQSCLATINFDHSKLELTGVDAGEILPSGTRDVTEATQDTNLEGVNSMYAWNKDNGGAAMIAYACGSDIKTNGIMFTLTFKLKDGVDKAAVNAAVTFYDENNKDSAGKIVPIETSTSAPAIIEVKASGITLGDLDGEDGVDDYDASLALQYFVGLIGDDDIILAAADVDGEDGVDDYDASLILQFFVGLIEKFPAEE